MNRSNEGQHPYALEPGEGWINRFGIDFNVKASEVQQGRGAAVIEYATIQGEEPQSHIHDTEEWQ